MLGWVLPALIERLEAGKALRPRIQIERSVPEEADEGHARIGARSIASEDGAETAATIGIPAASGLLHDLERGPARHEQDRSRTGASGPRGKRADRPCRRRCGGRRLRARRAGRPRAEDARGVQAAGLGEGACARRSASGSREQDGRVDDGADDATGGKSAQRLDRALAASPQEEDVTSSRRARSSEAAGGRGGPHDDDVALLLGRPDLAAVLDTDDLVGPATMPSARSQPAARSKSSPGVRIVTASVSAPTRISSGSSTADAVFAPEPASPPMRTIGTRRTPAELGSSPRRIRPSAALRRPGRGNGPDAAPSAPGQPVRISRNRRRLR